MTFTDQSVDREGARVEALKDQARRKILETTARAWKENILDVYGHGSYVGESIKKGWTAEQIYSPRWLQQEMLPMGVAVKNEEKMKAEGRTDVKDAGDFDYLVSPNILKPDEVIALIGEANFQLKAQESWNRAKPGIEPARFQIPLGEGLTYETFPNVDYDQQTGKKFYRPGYGQARMPMAGKEPITGFKVMNDIFDTWRSQQNKASMGEATQPAAVPTASK